MDVNLRKEILLDGISLDSLPLGPSVMIVNSPFSGTVCICKPMVARITNSNIHQGAGGLKTKKKDRDDGNSGLIAACMETLRDGGNVLIPCETAGRLLELVQVLARHWLEHKLGLYHLVCLTHMALNIPEFAKMQLEWMSDSLARGFYNGKPNPFELVGSSHHHYAAYTLV